MTNKGKCYQTKYMSNVTAKKKSTCQMCLPKKKVHVNVFVPKFSKKKCICTKSPQHSCKPFFFMNNILVNHCKGSVCLLTEKGSVCQICQCQNQL